MQENKTNATGKKSSILKEILFYAILFLVCLVVIPQYVMQKTIVDGESMEPTLQNGNHLLIDKMTYHFAKPKRFDIIVFYPYEKEKHEYFVKRVIALPGETIQIKGNRIFINGKRIYEQYGKDPMTYAGIAKQPILLGKDEYFVLGDNREISLDSRYEEVGLVHKKSIAGRAIFRMWPISKMGFLPKKE